MDERPGKRMRKRREEDRWVTWDKRIRDIALFLVGILGVIHELFLITEPRPEILIFLASLLGLPFILSADELRRKSNGNERE